MDAQEIAIVSTEVTKAQTELYSAVMRDTEAQNALEDAKSQAIIDGQIVGKNAEERDAKAAQVLAEYIGAKRITDADVKHKRMMLDRSVMNWERVKYTIRLLEVTRND